MYTGEICEGKLLWCKVFWMCFRSFRRTVDSSMAGLHISWEYEVTYMVFEIVSFQVYLPCKLGLVDFYLWLSIFTVQLCLYSLEMETKMISFPRLYQGWGKLYDLIGLSELTFASKWRHKLAWRHMLRGGVSSINFVFCMVYGLMGYVSFCWHLLRKPNLIFL